MDCVNCKMKSRCTGMPCLCFEKTDKIIRAIKYLVIIAIVVMLVSMLIN
jgi:hypothetical protein